MITISYLIPICNEINEIQKLIAQLKLYIRKELDEIVVLFDTQNGTQEVRDYIDKINVELEFEHIQFHRILHPLNNDFAAFKNFGKQHCSRDYVVQLDSDELMHEHLAKLLPQVLEYNQVDLINVPRINYVQNITNEDIQKWGWRVDEHKRINWPDFQSRIIRNVEYMKWENKVHERIVGAKTIMNLPYDSEHWSLIHDKTIERQRLQNQMYESI